MKKHCCKTIFILTAAVLCLLGIGTAAGKISLAPFTDGLPGHQSRDGLPGPQLMDGLPSHLSPEMLTDSQSPDDFPDHQITDTPPSAGSNIGNKQAPPESVQYDSNKEVMLRCMHYNEKEFTSSVNDTSAASDTLALEKEADAGSGTILGGIVPHHLLACRLMAEFFRTLAEDPPKTVIVIGPNHKLAGVNELQTSSAGWGTPYGILEANTGITDKLVDELGAARNNELFENEHSISSLVPYIKYYLPETKIVPVLLHGSYPLEKAKKLGSLLGETAADNPGTAVIASIDFSHYLDAAKADEMDLITWNTVRSWDLYAISLMGNDNLDSVPTITTLLTAMDAVSAKKIELTGHNNSSRIAGGGYEYTTSYFTMFFRRDGQVDTLP